MQRLTEEIKRAEKHKPMPSKTDDNIVFLSLDNSLAKKMMAPPKLLPPLATETQETPKFSNILCLPEIKRTLARKDHISIET